MAVVSPAGAFVSLILSPAGRRSASASRSHCSLLFGNASCKAASSRHCPPSSSAVRASNRNSLTRLQASKQPFAGFITAGQSRYAGWEVISRDESINRGFSVKATGGATPEVVVQEEKAADTGADGGREWEKESPNWTIKMLYDGDCPLCMREVDMLRERNKTHGTIAFVDISTDDYRPEDHADISFEDAMGRIHGITRDGKVMRNVEAFRTFYEAVGLGWVYAITQIELVGKMADVVYDIWAKYRLPLTRRPPLADIVEARRRKKECRTA